MKSNLMNFSAFCLLVTLLALSACQRQYDEPPITELPNLEATATIREIINMAGTRPVAIGDKVIKGTVIADDKSGNFFKQIVIQDSTAGIRIDIDAFSLYNDYPIGREVWVKCDGLFAWKDGDVVALAASTNTDQSRIPLAVYRQYVIGGERDRPIAPTVKTLATIGPDDYNTLVTLENVEFRDCYAGNTYAFASTQESKNTEIIECATSDMIVVRNSGFADFAAQLTPTGNGSITAVYNSFNGTEQLFIRNTNDVSTMTGNRCTPLANFNEVSITALRNQFTGSVTTASGKIRGIVISSREGTWFGDKIIVQDPNGDGIAIKFDDDHSFTQGDYVEVVVDGGVLEDDNGLLSVTNLPVCRAIGLPNPGNLSVTPRMTTVNDILTNAQAWESTLIQVSSATISGAATYGDFNVLVTDPTGAVTLWNRGADFAGDPLALGTGMVTAVIGEFNGTIQLNLRNLDDIDFTPVQLNQESIQNIRNLFTGTATNAPNLTKIVGIVISDIGGGNTNSRNVVIQEPNGAGIVVRFDVDHSFNLGEELEVNISNAVVEEFNGLLQVAGGSLANGNVISVGNSITPRVATVQDILNNHSSWESTLVNVQNATLSGGSTYGDFGVMINDPSGSMSMFSGFANFGGTALPSGTGDVTAVVGEFSNPNYTPQLNIRNLTDVNGFSGSGGGGTNTIMSIADVRALYMGSNATVPANRSIAGIVISDKDAENITGRNLIMQQTGGSGIVVRFDANNTTIALGDSIVVDISGGTVSEFNGLRQIDNVPNANATIVSNNNSITPRVATVQDILTNYNAWESTLVRINGATITGSATYAFGTTVSDGTGNIDMFTRSQATFSGNAVPSGSVNITAVVSEFNSPQVVIRNASDVQ